jgi:hypothetical protein
MCGYNYQEVIDGYFNVPYFRMHILGLRHSKQHQLMNDLEDCGQVVFYASSAFVDLEDLNNHFQARAIRSHSLWLRPGDIGRIIDDKDHYVAFRIPGNWIV